MADYNTDPPLPRAPHQTQPTTTTTADRLAGKITAEQENQDSPIFASATWDDINLPPPLLQAVRMMNFTKPSKIQVSAIPAIMEGRNVIGQSQSGTGKTACFGLGLLSRIEVHINAPQALVIAPTRELAKQIQEEIKRFAKYMDGVKIIACIPGYDFSGGVIAHVVVATAGRVWDAITKRAMQLNNMKVMCLDEADVMLEGCAQVSDDQDPFAKQRGKGAAGGAAIALQLKKRLAIEAPECQVLLFSATYPDSVKNFAIKFAPGAQKFTIKETKSLNLAYIAQAAVKTANNQQKYTYVKDVFVFCMTNQAVIFVNTRELSKKLAADLRNDGYSVGLLQAEMPGQDRDAVVDAFRTQQTRVLVATNVIARGMDVPETSVVINYELPTMRTGEADFETYLHRIGRCGRFGRPGIAINLVGSQAEHDKMTQIQQRFDLDLHLLSTNAEDLNNIIDDSINAV